MAQSLVAYRKNSSGNGSSSISSLWKAKAVMVLAKVTLLVLDISSSETGPGDLLAYFGPAAGSTILPRVPLDFMGVDLDLLLLLERTPEGAAAAEVVDFFAGFGGAGTIIIRQLQ